MSGTALVHSIIRQLACVSSVRRPLSVDFSIPSKWRMLERGAETYGTGKLLLVL